MSLHGYTSVRLPIWIEAFFLTIQVSRITITIKSYLNEIFFYLTIQVSRVTITFKSYLNGSFLSLSLSLNNPSATHDFIFEWKFFFLTIQVPCITITIKPKVTTHQLSAFTQPWMEQGGEPPTFTITLIHP